MDAMGTGATAACRPDGAGRVAGAFDVRDAGNRTAWEPPTSP